MSDKKQSVFKAGRISHWVIPAICLLGIVGCASVPELDKSIEAKTAGQLASSASFSAPAGAWPVDAWWKIYGDAQLNLLIDEALRDSPNMAIAQARVRHAQAMSQMAGASQLPQVRGNVALTGEKQSYNYLAQGMSLPQGWNDYGRATLDFSWELDFWGKNRAALAAATSERQAVQAELAQTRLMLASAVASAYAELAHLYAVRDTAAATLDLRKETAALFRQRYGSGLETMGSVHQMEARRAGAEAELLAIDERIALLRNGMAALLGEGPDRGLSIARPTVRFAGSSGLPQQLALDLLGRRPDIVAARQRTEAAAKRIDQQRAGFYPSVNLMGFIGFHSLGIDNLTQSGSSTGSVGPAISLPIFNTEGLQGQLRGAHAEYDMAVSGYNATLSNALREVADAVVSRKSLAAQLAALRASVAEAEAAQKIALHRYRGELSSHLDVLISEDALWASRRALADMESRALVLDVALVRALGGGYREPEAERVASSSHE